MRKRSESSLFGKELIKSRCHQTFTSTESQSGVEQKHCLENLCKNCRRSLVHTEPSSEQNRKTWKGLFNRSFLLVNSVTSRQSSSSEDLMILDLVYMSYSSSSLPSLKVSTSSSARSGTFSSRNPWKTLVSHVLK
jgi:hypothetical protein